MSEYKPNSHVYKEEQRQALEERKKIEKVVNGPVKIKKKSGISRFMGDIISDDATSAKDYVKNDVLFPVIKKTLFDIGTGVIEILLYGTSGKRKSGSLGSKVSYRNYYDNRDDRRDERRDDRPKSKFDYGDIVFDNRGEAEMVRDNMLDAIEKYGFVTVADLYDMCDETAPHTSNRYGWTNLRTSSVKRVRDGYIIDLPKAAAID